MENDELSNLECRNCGSIYQAAISNTREVVADAIVLIECPICSDEVVE